MPYLRNLIWLAFQTQFFLVQFKDIEKTTWYDVIMVDILLVAKVVCNPKIDCIRWMDFHNRNDCLFLFFIVQIFVI